MKSWGNAINGSLPKWNAAGCSDSWRHRPRNPHVRLCEPLCGLLRGGAVSLPPEKDFKPFSSRFSGGSSDSAEDKNRVPAEAQRSGFGGKRRRSGMSEFSPLSAETRDMELAPTRSRIKISKPGRELRFFEGSSLRHGANPDGGWERSAPAISVSPFHLTIPPKMRHNSPWKGCAHYAA